MGVVKVFQKGSLEAFLGLVAKMSTGEGERRDDNATLLEIMKSEHLIKGSVPNAGRQCWRKKFYSRGCIVS